LFASAFTTITPKETANKNPNGRRGSFMVWAD
jgi:hypothetical protein